MNTRTVAADLADDATAALAAAGVAPAHVTTDPTTVGGAAAGGAHVVLIDPPTVRFLNNNGATQADWSVWLVAGGEPSAAWDRLDALLGALREPLDLDTAEPAEFRDMQTSYAAFRATTTTDHDL